MKPTRPGFTLLEVILTLLISGLVVAAIAAAINIHLRVVETGRAEVEQAQLARSLLRRIADDLRSAVPVAKQESAAASTEELDALANAAAGASGSSGGSGSSSTSSGGGSSSSGRGGSGASGGSAGGASSGSSASKSSGGSSSSGSGTSSSSEQSTATDDTVVQPNFYGTQYQLQFDVGRLPDAQQFAAMSSDAALSGAAQAADSLSDVKTVAYFLGTTSNPAAAVDPFTTTNAAAATQGGLMRTEISRAASSFAYSQGGGATPTGERVLAPEVVALQFQYYDGTQWLTEWDTSTTQTLPLCVEVLLTLRTNSPAATTDPLALLTASSDVVEKTYRQLIHLPGSTATAGTSATTDASSTAETEATP